MLKTFFQKRPTPTDRPNQLRDLVFVILASGLVTIAIADKDYRQPFYLVAGSALTSHLVVKKSDPKQ